MSFTKMFGSITDSTVWGEPDTTRIVWITMLAMANREGFVHSSVPGLAHRARVSLEACEAALETFKSPDPYSRTVDHEGRRIEAVEGGWILLNYLKYREVGNPVRASLATEGYVYYIGLPEGSKVKIGFSKNPWARLDALRTTEPRLEILATERGTMQLEKDRHQEFNRERMEGEWFEYSPSLRSLMLDLSGRDERTIRSFKGGRTTTVAVKRTTVVAEAEAEADIEEAKSKALAQPSAARFDEWYAHYPVKKGKEPARKTWNKDKLDAQADDLITHTKLMLAYDDDWKRGYAPMASTYLNQKRWQDEPKGPRQEFTQAPSKGMNAILKLQEMTGGLDHAGSGSGSSKTTLLAFRPPSGGRHDSGDSNGMG